MPRSRSVEPGPPAPRSAAGRGDNHAGLLVDSHPAHPLLLAAVIVRPTADKLACCGTAGDIPEATTADQDIQALSAWVDAAAPRRAYCAGAHRFPCRPERGPASVGTGQRRGPTERGRGRGRGSGQRGVSRAEVTAEQAGLEQTSAPSARCDATSFQPVSTRQRRHRVTPRRKAVNVRFGLDEYAAIAGAANRVDLSPTAYVGTAALAAARGGAEAGTPLREALSELGQGSE